MPVLQQGLSIIKMRIMSARITSPATVRLCEKRRAPVLLMAAGAGTIVPVLQQGRLMVKLYVMAARITSPATVRLCDKRRAPVLLIAAGAGTILMAGLALVGIALVGHVVDDLLACL